jgi:hypothetical protein
LLLVRKEASITSVLSAETLELQQKRRLPQAPVRVFTNPNYYFVASSWTKIF